MVIVKFVGSSINGSTGAITALTVGSATITATALDGGGASDSATITVKDGSGIAIAFTGFGDETFDLDITDGKVGTVGTVFSQSNWSELNVSIISGGTIIGVQTDGSNGLSGNWGSSYVQIYPSYMTLCQHTITILVLGTDSVPNVPYSKVIKFTVVK